MMLLNFGARFIIADLGKFHEVILNNIYFKKIIIFSLFFVASRDIITAFLLTIFYTLIVDGILNERKKYCIVPTKYKNTTVGEADYLHAKNIVSAYESQHTEGNDSYDKYLQSIALLNSNAQI